MAPLRVMSSKTILSVAEEMDVRFNNRNTQKRHALFQKRFRKNGFDEQIASLTARVEEKSVKKETIVVVFSGQIWYISKNVSSGG